MKLDFMLPWCMLLVSLVEIPYTIGSASGQCYSVLHGPSSFNEFLRGETGKNKWVLISTNKHGFWGKKDFEHHA